MNNQEQYFRGHENICCMVFLNNMPMTWSHIAFNIHLDLIYNQCYPLNAKTKSFCFTFAVVIANSISFDYSRFLTSWNIVLKINWCEVLVANALWNCSVIPKPWIPSRVDYVLLITQFARNVDLILTILLKYSCSWIAFPRSLICKNLNVNSIC